jgi:H/ACA ribonucleoprotein complex subunit 3
MHKIRYCDACAQYTMQKNCSTCKGATRHAKPAKYSPEDKWGDYRRRAKAGETGEETTAPAPGGILDEEQ